MGRHTVTVDVDLADFDDEDVLRYAATLSGGSFGSRNAARDVRLLAKYIAHGRSDEALLALELLVGDDRVLTEAVDIGRRLTR